MGVLVTAFFLTGGVVLTIVVFVAVFAVVVVVVVVVFVEVAGAFVVVGEGVVFVAVAVDVFTSVVVFFFSGTMGLFIVNKSGRGKSGKNSKKMDKITKNGNDHLVDCLVLLL